MEQKTVRMIEFAIGGRFFDEYRTMEWDGQPVREMPCAWAHSYRTFERVTKTALVDGETFVKDERINYSGWVYPGGRIVTADDLEPGSIGQGNLRRSNQRGVIPRIGGLRFFNDKDSVTADLPDADARPVIAPAPADDESES